MVVIYLMNLETSRLIRSIPIAYPTCEGIWAHVCLTEAYI